MLTKESIVTYLENEAVRPLSEVELAYAHQNLQAVLFAQLLYRRSAHRLNQKNGYTNPPDHGFP